MHTRSRRVALAVCLVAGCTTESTRAEQAMNDRGESAMKKTRSKDGTEIAFEKTGRGPPVIIVGGAFNDRNTAAPLAASLAKCFTVFTYDRRGRGASGDTLPYAVAREVEDLRAVVDEAGGAAHAYGISSGGLLVLEAAAAGVPLSRIAVYEAPLIVEGRAPPS